jgi:hypothetical protein
MAPDPIFDFFELFKKLDQVDQIKIDVGSTSVELAPQQILYSQGDPPDAVYIVSQGVMEAVTQSPDGKRSRSVAYMGRGSFFGELAVLTGQPRLAMVRACEAATVLRFEANTFQLLLEKIPQLGAYFTRILAKRLHHTASEAHQGVYALDLSGNLHRFDLLTIFQAITAMNHSGELDLNNSANEPIGNFFFRAGRIEHARFVHLVGIEAVWQGFLQSATEGTFTFRVMDEPETPFSREHKVQLEAVDVLMQGATRRDAYVTFPAALRAMEGQLGRKRDTLEWPDPESFVLAERIWELIGNRPQLLSSLWRRLHYSALPFLETVMLLIETNHAEWIREAPVEDERLSPKPL